MRRAASIVALALLAAGCGATDERSAATTPVPTLDEGRYGPKEAVPRDRPPAERPQGAKASAAVARALDRGTVGVVDLTGKVAIRPRALETAKDATLERIDWARWERDGAEGRGELRLLVCDPSCANGTIKNVPARVTLSKPHTCAGRTYFDDVEVRLDPADATEGQPASYLRAPC